VITAMRGPMRARPLRHRNTYLNERECAPGGMRKWLVTAVALGFPDGGHRRRGNAPGPVPLRAADSDSSRPRPRTTSIASSKMSRYAQTGIRARTSD
jgi:hypothetical protein